MASPPSSRRCSRRLLAKCPEPIKKDIVNPLLRDLSTTKRVARNAQIVTQETCSANLSLAQDVPTNKKVCKDTRFLTQVPISPGDVLMSWTRGRKLTSNHSKTGPPSQAMRGKFLQGKNTNDTHEEESEDNLQQGLAKRGRFVQEKNNNDNPEEESENNFQSSLSKRGNSVQEKNNIDIPEEESEDSFQPCESNNPTQVEGNHCAAPFPPDEVSLNNHTRSASGMAITEIAALAEKHPHEDEDEIVSCYNPGLVTVGGYRVKEEFASLSRNIIKKYGDILENCSWETSNSRSAFLEMICHIIQRLQGSTFEIITPGELKNMLKEVAKMESIDIRVEWLHQNLDEIYEAKNKFWGACLVKEKKDRIRKDVDEVERALGHAQNMLQVWQNEMVLLREKFALLKSEGEEIETAEIDTRAKVTSFLQNHKSLVDGLL